MSSSGFVTDAVLEARAERVFASLERAAFGGDSALLGFQVALPDRDALRFIKLFFFKCRNVNLFQLPISSRPGLSQNPCRHVVANS